MAEIMDLINRMEYSIEHFFMYQLQIPQLAGYAGLLAWLIFLMAALILLVLVAKGVHAVKMFIAGSVPVKLSRTNPIKFHFLQEAGTLAIKHQYEEAGKKFSYRRDYTKADVQKEINEICLNISPLIITDGHWSELFTSWYNEYGPVSRKNFPQAVSDFYGHTMERIKRQDEMD